MDGLSLLRCLAPSPPVWSIDWTAVENSGLGSCAGAMGVTPQDPFYHGEGDVWTHTRMACEALTGMNAFRSLPEDQRQVLFLAMLLHDMGKTRCTRMEDGRWTSPNHSAVGAGMARQTLWLDHGLCGTPESQAFRETVCTLIRYHSVPAHAVDAPGGSQRLRAIAAAGELLPRFSLRLLCLLAEADALGRQCADRQNMIEKVQLCGELAREAGCYDGPYPFPSAHTRFAYLSGRNVLPDQPLYDDTWGPVVLLSGLPGTGKDTWISQHCPDRPQISLDQMREELGISPEDNQTQVARQAQERARKLLRQKQPFVWNATNLSPMIRQKQLALFRSYGAAARIVYLETLWEEQLQRNRNRTAAVPEAVLTHMLENLVLPALTEARDVLWYCV